MSNTSLAFRLATTSFLQETETRDLSKSADTQAAFIYVYSPEGEAGHVASILDRAKIRHCINQYEIRDYAGKVFCFHKRSNLSDAQVDFLVNAVSAGGQVVALLDYLEQRLSLVEVELLHSDYLLDNNLMRLSLDKSRQWQKFAIDTIMAVSLLVLTLPFWALIALAIKLESPGPVFFRQRRTGLFNKEFDILKFRSMRQDAEKDGVRWASKNDSRITRVGAFLRKTRMDELPQLINVLRGEMSIIGPRPEREVFIHDLEKHVPFYRFRHMVKPGVTGLAQVKYTYGASIEDAMHKHRHDMYYIKHQSLWMDLKILLQTTRIVLTGQGI
ncbi:MAG: sugar transferase [Thiothrix sp.]|uniref:sugar transferase n=1 Tax=Thiothrix sp. TaxID=1032 RepID=UPI0026110126|nr:sugar transferase [Thiothrix sp.]MDD5392659.1 sugar transferase [Thiothrix sp.]